MIFWLKVKTIDMSNEQMIQLVNLIDSLKGIEKTQAISVIESDLDFKKEV